MAPADESNPSRRDFLKGGAALGVAAGIGGLGVRPAAAQGPPGGAGPPPHLSPGWEPPRMPNEHPMVDVPYEGFDVVRSAVLGLGNRGLSQLNRFIPVSTVTAVADIRPNRVQSAVNAVVNAGQPAPGAYSDGEEDYLNLLQRDDVDVVYIATPWEWHYPMAKAAMEHGKHVLVELPIATQLSEIWDLVRTSERTGKHLTLLENVNYFRPEMRVLVMVKQGLFGDVLHGSGGYIHDLRNPYLFHGAYFPEGWRRQWQTRMNAAHYPMHGLGPVAACMDINRGDRFTELVSVTSLPAGLALYREENMAPDHPSWNDEYISGDRNVSFVKTANGRFIRVEHDVNTPHPYSRATTVVGTRGVWSEVSGIYLETLGHFNHSWRTNFTGNAYSAYDHWLWQDIGNSAAEYGGHGGGDFISIFRAIQCMRLGLTPDIDVYDSAAWCSVIPLSHHSVTTSNSFTPVKVPDFTRGYWQAARPGIERGRPT